MYDEYSNFWEARETTWNIRERAWEHIWILENEIPWYIIILLCRLSEIIIINSQKTCSAGEIYKVSKFIINETVESVFSSILTFLSFAVVDSVSTKVSKLRYLWSFFKKVLDSSMLSCVLSLVYGKHYDQLFRYYSDLYTSTPSLDWFIYFSSPLNEHFQSRSN